MTMIATVNIASHVSCMAQRRPYALAVVSPHGRDRRGRVSYTHYTFRQLDQESDCLARGLEALGIGRGVRAVLMVPPTLEFFALTFALFKVGAVPILIDPGMGIKNLGRCLAEAEPAAFVGTPKAHLARRLFGWARKTLGITVSVSAAGLGCTSSVDRIRATGGYSQRAVLADTHADDLAAILFTSGSTGAAKGAVYTHGIFTAQVGLLQRLYHIEPGEIDLATFPLFALFAPALGMTAVIPDMDPTRPAEVDPSKIIEAVEDFGVTNLFGSPALLHRVGTYGAEQGIKLPSLRRVISAGAPVPAKVIDRFVTMLSSGVQVFTPYGATEALPVASIGSDEILGEGRLQTERGAGVCIGRPVPDTRVAVIPIDESPIPFWCEDLTLPAGHIGEIVVQGRQVTNSYFNRPDATALAKIPDPVTQQIFHRMGDLGYFDEEGCLWFCGRKSQRVVTATGTFYTIPCEAVFNTHPKVYRTALVGVARGKDTLPVLCVQLTPEHCHDSQEPLKRELLALGGQHPHTKGINTILFKREFPVDIRHNAKIFREKLARWAARKLR